jgi:hypothetical protein
MMKKINMVPKWFSLNCFKQEYPYLSSRNPSIAQAADVWKELKC